MSPARNDNDYDRDDKIIFTIRDTKLHVPVVTLSAKDNQKLSKLLNKDQFIGMNIKRKVRIKIQQMNRDILTNQILLELIENLF